MQRYMLIVFGLGLASTAIAETAAEKARRQERLAYYERLFQIERRIKETEPKRRDSPARYLNISDNEVREVQSAAFSYLPRSLVNIGTVVTGCPCEEGPNCADQVWLVVNSPDPNRQFVNKGLLLSKIDGRWTIGPIQKWWLSYDELKSRESTFSSIYEFWRAEEKLKATFPTCAPK
jgi:hypothetical protein